MPAPTNAAASAFFPPSMPNFWNSAAFIHQQQMNAAAAMYANGAMSSPVPPLPLYPPSASAFPPLLPPHSTVNSAGGAASAGPLSMTIPNNPLTSPPAAPSPTFPSTVPTPSPPVGAGPGESIDGIGTLVWLSSKAGLIKAESDAGSVSFQLKDFCDQAVSDLTSVLRPGFTLQFWAVAAPGSVDGSGGWVATFVRPLPSLVGRDIKNIEADLEAPPGMETGPPQLPKDPYCFELEKEAVPMLLGIFQRNAVTYCQLSSFHMQISNCGDENLYRYVGTSSLKRRQFLERRSHLFHISQTDTVSLQPPALYTTIVTLVKYLLKHGGSCLLQELFDHFNGCPEIPLEARDSIGEGKNKFLRFLESHPWIFAVFPSRVFVSVRRQLPHFDYAAYMHEHFGDQELNNLGSSYSGSGGNGDVKPTTNGWSDPAEQHPPTPTLNGAPKFGSSASLSSMGDHHYHMGVNGTGIPPTPTHSLPPSTPLWPSAASIRSPFLDERSSSQSAMFPPLPDSSGNKSIPFPPPGFGAPSVPPPEMMPPPPRGWGSPGSSSASGVGGRIKRFTDIDVQTDYWMGHQLNRPMMVNQETQTRPETTTIACGEGESEMKAEEECKATATSSTTSSSSGGGSSSSKRSAHSSGGDFDLGTTETGVFMGFPEMDFNPMSDSPISQVLTAGILKHLSLSDK